MEAEREVYRYKSVVSSDRDVQGALWEHSEVISSRAAVRRKRKRKMEEGRGERSRNALKKR